MTTTDEATDGTPAAEVLTIPEAAALLKVSEETLKRWRRRRIGPAWVELETGGIRYQRTAVRSYLTSRTVDIGQAVA